MKRTPQPAPGTSGAGVFDLVRYLLDEGEREDAMTRYQDPKIEIRRDVKRPFYYIRPYVRTCTEQGIKSVRKNIPLGFCDKMTTKQAQAAKQQEMATINAGKFLLQCQIHFDEAIKKFVAGRVPQLAAPTQGKYLGIIDHYIRPAFGKLRMCDIDPPMVAAWLNKAAEPRIVTVKRKGKEVTEERDGLSWWARQDLRNALSAIFTQAVGWRMWDGRNPCEGADLGRKREKREKRIPKAEQLEAFLAALPNTKVCTAEQARLMVLVAAVAGLRVSEVLGLKPSDIGGEKETIEIRRRWHRGDVDIPKTEASRRVREIGPLAGELLRLARGKDESAFLFAQADGNPPDDRDLQQHVFRPAAKAVGIYFEGFGMHTFRRLNVSWRQEVGATAIEAMKAAGHTSLSMTWAYTVTDREREKEQVQKMWDRLAIDNVQGPVN